MYDFSAKGGDFLSYLSPRHSTRVILFLSPNHTRPTPFSAPPGPPRATVSDDLISSRPALLLDLPLILSRRRLPFLQPPNENKMTALSPTLAAAVQKERDSLRLTDAVAEHDTVAAAATAAPGRKTKTPLRGAVVCRNIRKMVKRSRSRWWWGLSIGSPKIWHLTNRKLIPDK